MPKIYQRLFCPFRTKLCTFLCAERGFFLYKKTPRSFCGESVVNIFPVKKRGIEKIGNPDLKTFTDFMDYSELHAWIKAVHNCAQRRLRHTAFYKKLILRHAPFAAKFGYSFCNGFIKLHLCASCTSFTRYKYNKCAEIYTSCT